MFERAEKIAAVADRFSEEHEPGGEISPARASYICSLRSVIRNNSLFSHARREYYLRDQLSVRPGTAIIHQKPKGNKEWGARSIG
jgi:hypothetical protein